jgi:hexosaminidase
MTFVWAIVPQPSRVEPVAGVRFVITDTSVIAASTDALRVAEYLADLLGLPVVSGAQSGCIALRLDGLDRGEEGYELEVGDDGIALRATTETGLFRGVQTLRQILVDGTVPGVRIVDRPRFAYRGVMLDVARHFFGVADVKRLIDIAALYKVNHLHLHLTDDQGWRIAISTWPRLGPYGGGTEVGGGPGGHYSTEEYREIVAYAQSRFMTVVPEIDLPGHTNAALASYPELACGGPTPERYTGIEVGFSALCPTSEVTYRFLDEVFGEIAALTPGPYLHIGGDEAKTLSPQEYDLIVTRAQEIVASHGKAVIGWHEVAQAKLAPDTVLQYWGVTPSAPDVVAAAARGNAVIMSPADRTYLDMKYGPDSPLGLVWAGYLSVRAAYEWDPHTYVTDLDPAAVYGVESPLWTETVETMAQIEYMALPRLAVIAEVGWSSRPGRDWNAFSERLGGQARHWDALGLDYFRDPEVPWSARR